jgi:hypothetical protein
MEKLKPRLIQDLGCFKPKPTSNYKRRYGIFECPYCGKIFRTDTVEVNKGRIVSCGCHLMSLLKGGLGTTHGLSKTKIHAVWGSMKGRCTCKRKQQFRIYGSKGITVCDEWKNDFMSFYNWAMASGYKDGLEIDRIDNDKGYYPENCRWVTKSQNQANSRLIRASNTTGYRGVFRDNRYIGRWRSQIKVDGKLICLGYFDSKHEAALTYNNFVIKNKTFHPLNIIPNDRQISGKAK